MGKLIPIYVNVNDLPKVREVLFRIGFRDIIILQTWKENQIWGVARDVSKEELFNILGNPYLIDNLTDLQCHIRAYSDGRLESEIEIHRNDLRHLVSPTPSNHEALALLLSREGISHHFSNAAAPMDSIERLLHFPKNEKIEWKPYAALFGIISMLFLILYQDNI